MSIWFFILAAVTVAMVVLLTAWLKVHPFLSMLGACFFFAIASGIPTQSIGKYITDGFAETFGSIGIVIIIGSIIGTFLQRSYGSMAIAQSILKLTGKKHVPLAMSLMGYFTSICVFCDSGFVMLSPLNRELSRRSGQSIALTSTALSLGLYATHTLVPPASGPLAACAILGADIGLVISVGLFVSFVSMLTGLIFSVWAGKKVSVKVNMDYEPVPDEVKIPNALLSFLPISAPLLLMILRSLADMPSKPFGTSEFYSILSFAGSPVTALLIGMLLSFLLVRNGEKDVFGSSGWVGQALKNCFSMVLITCAGGALGKVLASWDISDINLNGFSSHSGILVAFVVAALIKTMQGSSAVAIVTASSIMFPLLGSMGLDSPIAKALVVCSVGAGSMVLSHVNDSYFWVVSQMSGMDIKASLKLQTMGSLVQGSVTGMLVWLMSFFLL
ncbi:MAG TPA: GntP family permease [Petrotogaceae bacterium]|jgi:GntP family gluconate:H+ symporter|nr:GntP family permease [Petrotogaceae bacterium]HNV06600.1 GntP family permease [Petrotogaceae bacterium]